MKNNRTRKLTAELKQNVPELSEKLNKKTKENEVLHEELGETKKKLSLCKLDVCQLGSTQASDNVLELLYQERIVEEKVGNKDTITHVGSEVHLMPIKNQPCANRMTRQLHLKTTKNDVPGEPQALGKVVEQRFEQCECELTILEAAIQGQLKTNKRLNPLLEECKF